MMARSRYGPLWACLAFVLTAFVFIDLGMSLIFGVGVLDIIGGSNSPLTVALADQLTAGNAALFWLVFLGLIIVFAYLMYVSAMAVKKRDRL